MPFGLVGQVREFALAVDAALLGERGWEQVAARDDAGLDTWLGIVPTDAAGTHPAPYVDRAMEAARRTGLGASFWAGSTIGPACGLAGAAPTRARAVQRLVVDAAGLIDERLSDL